jgi:hypothetical protein
MARRLSDAEVAANHLLLMGNLAICIGYLLSAIRCSSLTRGAAL